MQNLANSTSLEVTSALVQCTKIFVQHSAFAKIQPVGWVKDSNFDLASILSCSKNNYPFGYCPNNEQYIVDAVWNWSKLLKDLPISRLAFSLILGVETYSSCILQNVGRKKIKLNQTWSHRLTTTAVWYNELTSCINLSKLTDAEILESIEVAQKVIDTVCTLTFSETSTQVEPEPNSKSGQKYEARRILSSMYMMNITTEMSLSFDDRVQFLKMPKPYSFKNTATALKAYTEYFMSILDRLDYSVISDLISDLVNNDLDLLLGVLTAINVDQITNVFMSSIQEQLLAQVDRLNDTIVGKRLFI
ncbi:hypothetical protein HLH17_16320 [Acinetobacter sp. ANC 5380]|uniref:Uncharacterized protein n=1 Tax=Acinetobacter terrae TaxID=2731247 RepID=A0A7Y2RI15_9GAMM|nr:hypothetical protein [Acinetobacter terrae]NNH79183.1 hypothetical protein [Acinetobacter terrae]